MGIFGYDNEFQAAFDSARSQYVSGCEKAKAEELAKAGQYPVCTDITIYCPHTDAIMANEVHIVKTFKSLRGAMDYVGKHEEEFEYGLWVATVHTDTHAAINAARNDPPEDDIPF